LSMVCFRERIVFQICVLTLLLQIHDKHNGNNMPQPTSPSTPATSSRLPCRGCLPDCSNYATCNGTPWRAEAVAPRIANSTKGFTGDQSARQLR
jgi:hypothetical protein